MIERLKIDYSATAPTDQEIAQMWLDMEITELNEWSKYALELKDKFSETHCMGGIQLHKYQVSDSTCLQWFASRNRLSNISFVKNIFSRPELQGYRNDLGIKDNRPACQEIHGYSDIFDLTGIISRILNQGGAYRNLEAKDAWESAMNFVNQEFENRFDEVNRYRYILQGSKWFYDIAWDYSTLLFDKRKNQILIMDITDVD
ncbi:hypothetical protein DZ858_13085 [Marixanthomonas ophiurae]|uniref:Uncharacterized protein n=2 Tax=Marixanthomonas ophiurae TaxID=387659 RepID=A0A3E1Q7R9_9FLAO|nr:hypothetical protein DZ858_13085 [Marixanthomonas ophiurae]